MPLVVSGVPSAQVQWTETGGNVSSGVYTAPTTPGIYEVTGTVGTAKATIEITVEATKLTVFPSSVTVGANSINPHLFGALVANNIGGGTVSWAATGGSVTTSSPDSQGNPQADYTAPPTPGNYTVTASLNTPAGISATSNVTVVSAGSVTLNPANTVISNAGSTNSVVLKSAVYNSDGTLNTAVQLDWTVLQGAGAGALTNGTSPNTMVFTASSSVSGVTAVIIRVARHDNPSNYATSTISIQPGTGTVGPITIQ